MSKRITLVSGIMILFMLACNKEVIDKIASFTGFQYSPHFPEPVYTVSRNTPTQAGFELGRKLFYDARLSRNNTISCGTCHIQSAAFTHHGHDVSHGIEDRLGTRNSQPIMNLAWNKHFFWDGGVFDLDLQPIAPITNHLEMDETVDRVLDKLRQDKQYPFLFEKTFGSGEITAVRMLKALSQFMLLCISDQSKYDSVMRKEADFTAIEAAGYEVFKTHCANCHREPLFSDHSFRNNGLPPTLVPDEGRFLITLNAADRFSFRVPSLRNLAYTAPYMHDGRFYSLDAVLDHYQRGIQITPNLDSNLQKNGLTGIQLSTEDRSRLLAFLQTLNDKKFITNPLLAEQ
ncbi:cytochrome-c peroxidase [Sediminibacterium goheungense]|uniref:Cytochrome c peroxidase n=1 Tax=Sediminibacterium goheungense TaxID=1086393 RepID=A0A4R6IV64_9BACT|nr:cytochrome c peroxidase [Sediminibacterium goheungense]TDO26529.1 cytochrome c peroxidase [Sediminibacterium goheungense]